MRIILVLATLLLNIVTAHAQEKVMKVRMKDGTTAQTRVADLKQISFLTVEEGGQGLLVKTTDGKTAAVLFEARPVVTAADGRLVIKPAATAAVEFEIADIEEIQFGDASTGVASHEAKGLTVVLQDHCALLCGIPDDVTPRVYAVDGRSMQTPPVRCGQLRLSREMLGKGFFIVKVGDFSAKIRL